MKFWLMGFGLGPRDLVTLARDAEDVGFDGLVVSDQLYFPADFRTRYHNTESGVVTWTKETPWPEPWCAISAMAAVTERIRLGNYTYVAPNRSVLNVAKAVATAAALAGDRIMLGASGGWLRQQFETEGLSFETRGARLEEMIAALRLLWSGDTVEYHGRDIDFEPLSINPVPAGGTVPIYVGGDSQAAMDRAARLADGWLAMIYPTEEAVRRTQLMLNLVEKQGRDPARFDVIMSLGAVDRQRAETLAAAGVGGLVVSTGSVHTPSGVRETKDQLTQLARALGVGEY
jgi:probable F420-dependent oxidoreductase